MQLTTRGARDLVLLVTLALVGMLVGRGTSMLIAGACFETTATRVASPPGSFSARAPRDGCALLERPALFGRGSSAPCAAPAVAAPGALETAPTSRVPCDGALRLVGAVVPPRGHTPFAAIVDGSGASLLYAPGMRVGDRVVTTIDADRVTLTAGDGGACTLAMFAPRPAPTIASRGPWAPAEPSGVRQTGPASYRVPASMVRTLLASPRTRSLVRVMPHQDGGGTIDGFRVDGVRAGSLPSELGLANGDIVTAVGDRALADPAAALEVYAMLPSAPRVELHVVRRGQPLTLTYDIE